MAATQARHRNLVLNRLSFGQSNLTPTLAGGSGRVRTIIVLLDCGATVPQGVRWPLAFKFPCGPPVPASVRDGLKAGQGADSETAIAWRPAVASGRRRAN